MRSYADLRDRFHGTGAVLSVHNAGYQGYFSPSVIGDLGIPPETFNLHQLEWYGKVNFLKGGLAFADYAVTVSPSHAEELRTPDGGFGLHAMFTSMGDRFQGITNGIDVDKWNPATDTEIAANFTREDTSNKAECKAQLQQTFGLPQRSDIPIIGMCGRLVKQKGFDIILPSKRSGPPMHSGCFSARAKNVTSRYFRNSRESGQDSKRGVQFHRQGRASAHSGK